jgi:signal peptidase
MSGTRGHRVTWRKALYTAALCAALLAAACAVAAVVAQNRQDGIFGYRCFVVLSDSMRPRFSAGDVVVCKKVDPAGLQVGDIVTFSSPDPLLEGALVTHAIVAVGEEEGKTVFLTAGLNNGAQDAYPVEPGRVVGRFCFSIPGLGAAVEFLKSPAGYFICLLAPLSLLAARQVWRIIKLVRARAEEQKEALERERQKVQEERLRLRRMMDEVEALKAELGKRLKGVDP